MTQDLKIEAGGIVAAAVQNTKVATVVGTGTTVTGVGMAAGSNAFTIYAGIAAALAGACLSLYLLYYNIQKNKREKEEREEDRRLAELDRQMKEQQLKNMVEGSKDDG